MRPSNYHAMFLGCIARVGREVDPTTPQELRRRAERMRSLRREARAELRWQRDVLLPSLGKSREAARVIEELAALQRLVAGAADFERDLRGALAETRAAVAGAIGA